MAESSEGAAGGGACGNWWGDWLQTVKDKSVSAYDLVSKDLSEFSQTMQVETKKVVKGTSESIKDKLNQETTSAATNKVKAGLTSFLNGISKALVIEPDDEDEQLLVYTNKGDPTPIFDKAKARLHSIQVDPETYCQEPSGPPEQFHEWLNDFNLDEKKGIISELLVSKIEVRTLYTQMVPSVISHAVFWQRYFYRIHQLEQDEARRADLKKRANDIAGSIHEDVDWGNDSEDETEVVKKLSNEESTPFQKQISEKNNETSDPVLRDPIVYETIVKSSDINEIENVQNADATAQNISNIADGQTCVIEKNNIAQSGEAGNALSDPNNIHGKIIDSSVSEPEVVAEKPEQITDVIETKSDVDACETDMKTKEKGDMIVVGMGSITPTISSSEASSNGKDSLEDDWEKDFDLEITEEDLKLAQELAKNVSIDGNVDLADDDWENWE
ncbi:BSD domain-containing protein 1-like [Tubulanus polymorphus]|uniref:BSD domain-containing protein 1-like n=1 Tax=Tubulanus polymorphus TaxID=672921 RepID=UPI003DA488C4